ncbi:MAG: Npt1/Npt2 family nucleotide transporter [Gemmatimonadota bacterium]
MLTAIRSWSKSLTDIRRDEIVPVALMFVYGFLALTSYYVLKPVRNSVFVDRVGADNLPFVYILTAIFVAVVMLGYSRYVDRVRQLPLLLGTFAFLASNLILFWWLLRDDSFVVSGAFYIWGKLYPLLVVSQYWLVGNLLFSTRQARRLFGIIGLGPILGGVAGSTISGFVATLVGTRTLLLMAALILLPCAALVVVLGPRMKNVGAASGRLMRDISGDAVRLLRQSSHLKTIALILGLTIVVGTLIDWQFNSAVEAFVPGEDQKTAFFGRFFALLNVGSVLVQLFLTGFVLRKFGIGLAMLALPVGLLVTSVGLFVAPVLLTAALMKGMEGGMRYSLDQSTRELLYLPVPTDVKYKVKPLIDMAVYRGGTGIGGLLLLLTVRYLGFSIRHVAILSVFLIVAWVAATLRMRGEFRESIKRLIGVRDVDLEDLIVQRLNAETITELRAVLAHGDEQEVLYALTLIEHHASGELVSDLQRLLEHESAPVRARALARLYEIGEAGALPDVFPLLQDPSLLVRVEAIHFVCRYGRLDADRQMDEFLQHPDSAVRLAALACPLQSDSPDLTQRERAEQALAAAARSPSAAERRDVARELSQLESLSPRLREVLERLLADSAEAVRHEAMRAVGAAQSREFIPTLVSQICCGSDREVARAALAQFGPEAHEQLIEILRDPAVPERARIEIPPLLYRKADQRTVDVLFETLHEAPPPIRFRILKTLDKLRRDRDDLVFEQLVIRPLVRREVAEGYRWAAALHVLVAGNGRPDSLLTASLRQRSDEAAERALRVLGLHYPLEDLYAAYTGLQSADPLMRSRGFELLDNTLPREYRQLFDPLLNPDESLASRAAAATRFGIRLSDRRETMATLAAGDDRWVAALTCIELGCGEPKPPAVAPPPFHVHSLAESVIGMSQAESALEEKMLMATTIEKAEVIRRTDLFGHLRTKDQAIVAALADEREYEAGEVIFEEGEASTELLIVVEGRITARRDCCDIFFAEAGETVGDLALLDGLPRNYQAVATEPTRVLVLEREAFFNLLEERFQIVRDVLAHISGVVRKLNVHEAQRRC